MTQAVTIRRDGDTFQARQFWLRAGYLLDSESPVVKVGFEQGPKGFDDIWVEYDPARAHLDALGQPIIREHIQCKWHGTPDSYGFAHLLDPEFINANSRSLLQRAHEAQIRYAPTGAGARFKLLTNWRPALDDPLRRLINNRAGALRLDRLYGTSTDNSTMGRVRKAWREHLGLDETTLRVLAGTLAFGEATDSLEETRQRLDLLFRAVGLLRIPPNQSDFRYDTLVFEWMAQGRLEFDRASFTQACGKEGLLTKGQARPTVFGVKSFEHPVDPLEDRCTKVLNLVPKFHERFIYSEADWSEVLYPELSAFLLSAAREHERIRLVLDAHATLAFAAGSVLDIKSGRKVELEQRTLDRQIWSADDATTDPGWPGLGSTVTELDRNKPDLAIAFGITHDISKTVATYVSENLPTVGRIISFSPAGGSGTTAVRSGRHAFALAEALCASVQSLRRMHSQFTTHLFVAAPNALTFFVGQRRPTMGRVTLYEYDFEGMRDHSYRASLTLPVP